MSRLSHIEKRPGIKTVYWIGRSTNDPSGCFRSIICIRFCDTKSIILRRPIPEWLNNKLKLKLKRRLSSSKIVYSRSLPLSGYFEYRFDESHQPYLMALCAGAKLSVVLREFINA